MITAILIILFLVIWGTFIAQKRFKILSKEIIADANVRGGYREEIRFNYKPIVLLVAGFLFIMFQPYGMKKIEAGYQGLKVNLIGDSRGASNIQVVSGLILYNSYTEEVHEVPLDQRNINYKKTPIVAKGGFACDITPSFNYSVKPGAAANMFTSLRSTYKSGGLEAIESGWLHNAIIGAVNDVANTFVIDDIFNNRTKFEAAILIEVNKRVGKWFEISQLKTNITPPASISSSINAKAKAVQDAITSAAQADAARADKERRVALAQADSAEVVIRALAEAKAVQLKEQKLTPLYIDYMKIEKWDGRLPTTTTGGSGSFINIK